jgi:peroxiredoxin
MTIAAGDTLPAATFKTKTADGLADVTSADALGKGLVAVFGVPGAYTPTCHNAHVPSFIEAMDDLKAKGVTTVACVSVNDPFVLGAWGEATGATAAGITMLADPEAAFVKALGLTFDGGAAGLGIRASRFSMLVENGVVKTVNTEDAPGQATSTRGEELVKQI